MPPIPQKKLHDLGYRSPLNLDDTFGAVPRPTQDDADFAEGFQVGNAAVATVYDLLREQHKDRGPKFIEGVLEGLRENL